MKTTIPQILIFRTFSRLKRSSFSAVFLLLFLLFFGINAANAQKTWDGGGDGVNWNSVNNWSPDGVPTSSDAVTIASNGTVTVNTSSAVCASLQLGGTSNNTRATLTFASSGSPKLTVTGAVTIGGEGSTNSNRGGTITFVSGSTLQAGSIILTKSTSGDDAPGIITMVANSTLLTGSFAIGQGSRTWTPSTGTVELTANNTLPSSTFTTFNNLIISGGTTTTGVALTTVSNLSVKSASTFSLSHAVTTNAVSLEGGCAVTGGRISGSVTLTLGGNVTVTDNTGGTAGATISCPVALGATRTITVDDDGTTATDLTMTGVISGSFGITKNGAGELHVSGANTYTGTTTVSVGKLKLGASSSVSNAGPLGTTSAGTTVTSGAVLDLNGFSLTSSSTEALTLNGTGISSGGALTNSSGTASNYIGLITIASTTSIITNAGNINLTNTGAISSDGLVVTIGGSGNGQISGVFSANTNGITKIGAGTWTLSGTNNYAGSTLISAGTLKLGNTSALGSASGSVTVASGGALDLNGYSLSVVKTTSISGTGVASLGAITNSSASSASYSGAITLAANSSIVGETGSIAISNTGQLLGPNFTLTLGGTTGGSFSSILNTQSGGLTKIGSGTWTINAWNFYTGTTIISEGTLKLGIGLDGNLADRGPLGSNTSGTTVIAGAVLDLNGFSFTTSSTPEALTLNGSGISSGGALTNTGAAATFNGPITLASASTIIATTSGTLTCSGNVAGAFGLTLGGAGTGTMSGVISTPTSLTKSGAGTWTLSGTNTYTGTTTVSEGNLVINNTSALGANTNSLVISTGAKADIKSNETVGSMTLGGTGTASGTWGFTGSGATNINATFFTNSTTGIITVSTDSRSTPTVTPTVGTYTYNGSAQGPNTAANTGTGTSYTFSYSGTGGTSYGPSSTRPTNAGTYTVTVTVAANANYTAASSSATAFTIAQANLTITANNQTKCSGTTFTFAGTEFTTSGLLDGNTVTSATLTSTGSASSTTASTYPIVATNAAGTGLANYAISYVNGTLTVNAPPVVTAAANTTTFCGSGTVNFTGTTNIASGTSVVADEDFEDTSTYTAVGGSTKTGTSGSGDRPASASFVSSPTTSYWVNSGTATVTTQNFTGLQNGAAKTVSMHLASFSIGSTSNGADSSDNVWVDISLNGGSTYSREIEVNGGSTGNAHWGFSTGTGVASVTYDGNNTATIFAPTGGGARTTDGFKLLQITLPTSATQVRVRVRLFNNSGSEAWIIDDITVSQAIVPTYSWTSNPSGFTSSLQNPTGVSVTTSTDYTLVATDPSTGCSGSDEVAITVNSNNTATAASSTPTLCVNTALTNITHTTTGATGIGTATGLPSGVTPAWASNTITISGTPTNSGTFNYSIPLTGGCGSVNATGTITVTAAPSAGSLGGTQAICVGGTSNLSSTESGGTWQSDDSGIATINSTTGVATGISSGVATMTYTITGTGGCSNATATTTVTVNSAPSVGTLSGTQTVCVGATTTFSSTESGESWTSGSTGVATINSSTGVITGVSAGTAIITYTFSGNGVCENATATRTVTVTPTFIASVSIASSDVDNTICPGTSVTFTATPTNGGTSPSYQWKLNGSTNVGSNSPTFVTTALANNDLVTVEMTSNETCVTSSPATSNSISTTVDSNLPASVSIISSDNDNTICSGSNVVFTATPTNGGSPSYQWKLNGNSIGSDSNTFTSSSLADNDVISVVMSSQTCSSGTAVTSNSITTVVNPSSVGGTVNSPTLCYNTAGNILLSGYTGTIQWQQSADGLTGWTNISGATSNTYTTPNLTAANSYRAVVTSGICSSANSNVSVVNVDDENVNTWIGTSGNWNDATKWRCGTVPTGITDVVVSGGSPVINADCSVKSITVSGTGLVTVQSSVTLTMTEGITTTVATQFVLENNANLLQGDSAQNVGPIIVKRNSSSIMRLDYTLWSSPVASQGLYAFSKATLPNRFYKYDTETNLYSNSVGFNLTNLQYPSPLVAPNGINGTDSNNVMFNTGQGYLIRVPWNHPIAPAFWTGYFVGVPNNGTINYTMSDFGVGKRFNLVGNPYPSPISISQFVQDNATNITSSVYFFRKTNGNTTTGSYCEWNDEIFTSNNDNQAFDPNDSVRTGQGFFVEATGAGNTIVFNNGQRVNDAGNQFFRQNANNTLTSQNVFWLNLTGTATQFSQTAISYKDYATNGVDRYDAKRMSPGTISLTSLVDGFNMGIQSKSAFVDTDVVLLSMIVPTAGSYSITLDRKSGLFADGQIIYLKDKLLNVDFNLATGSYTFVSEAGTFNDRFEIQYERNSLGVTSPIFNENQVVIYKTPTGSLSIKTGNVTMSLVKVFDVSGKLLFEKKDINASQTEFNIGLTTEILLVQITSDDGVVVTKKVLFPRTTLKIDKKIEVKSQLAEDE